jgi:hypothetical protein
VQQPSCIKTLMTQDLRFPSLLRDQQSVYSHSLLRCNARVCAHSRRLVSTQMTHLQVQPSCITFFDDPSKIWCFIIAERPAVGITVTHSLLRQARVCTQPVEGSGSHTTHLVGAALMYHIFLLMIQARFGATSLLRDHSQYGHPLLRAATRVCAHSQ